MAFHCAACGSPETEQQFDTCFCFVCGAETDSRGNVMPRKPQFIAKNHQEKRAAGEVF